MLTHEDPGDQGRLSFTVLIPAGRRQTDRETTEEDELIHRVANHDNHAFATLYARYAPSIRAYLQRRLSDHATVDEALDDVMMVIWHKATDCPANVPLLAWLYGIARYTARKHSRRSDRQHAPLAECVSGGDEPEVRLLAKDRAHTLACAISTLPCHERQPVELLVYHGLSYKEIAIRLDTPMNTIKTRMMRARTRLTATLASSARLGLGRSQ